MTVFVVVVVINDVENSWVHGWSWRHSAPVSAGRQCTQVWHFSAALASQLCDCGFVYEEGFLCLGVMPVTFCILWLHTEWWRNNSDIISDVLWQSFKLLL